MSKIPTTEQSDAMAPEEAAAEEEIEQSSHTERMPQRDISGASDPTIKNK